MICIYYFMELVASHIYFIIPLYEASLINMNSPGDAREAA
jgi:hypothetical protein